MTEGDKVCVSTECSFTLEVMTIYRRQKEIEYVSSEWSFPMEVMTVHGREENIDCMFLLNGQLRWK